MIRSTEAVAVVAAYLTRRLKMWEERAGFQNTIIWRNVFGIALLHLVTLLWTLYVLAAMLVPKWQTVVFFVTLVGVGMLGVTAGAHRYYAHRSYKATLPLQIILLLCFSIAGQNSVRDWVRDHRLHHKHSDTEADPHNSRRGFWFSHIGWQMMRKNPEVLQKGQLVDVRDIDSDPLIRLHTRYFSQLKLMLCFVVPTLLPIWLWGESWCLALCYQPLLRYTCCLNITFMVNSLAHRWGTKPYDKKIHPVQNKTVSFFALGEGWHNYHHTFPWDYRAAELGSGMNVTTLWLNAFRRLGWAYDVKQASGELVRAVAEKRGDGSDDHRPVDENGLDIGSAGLPVPQPLS